MHFRIQSFIHRQEYTSLSLLHIYNDYMIMKVLNTIGIWSIYGKCWIVIRVPMMQVMFGTTFYIKCYQNMDYSDPLPTMVYLFEYMKINHIFMYPLLPMTCYAVFGHTSSLMTSDCFWNSIFSYLFKLDMSWTSLVCVLFKQILVYHWTNHCIFMRCLKYFLVRMLILSNLLARQWDMILNLRRKCMMLYHYPSLNSNNIHWITRDLTNFGLAYSILWHASQGLILCMQHSDMADVLGWREKKVQKIIINRWATVGKGLMKVSTNF
jgi:hypothetical protein